LSSVSYALRMMGANTWSPIHATRCDAIRKGRAYRGAKWSLKQCSNTRYGKIPYYSRLTVHQHIESWWEKSSQEREHALAHRPLINIITCQKSNNDLFSICDLRKIMYTCFLIHYPESCICSAMFYGRRHH
jgi:hypothetical protein